MELRKQIIESSVGNTGVKVENPRSTYHPNMRSVRTLPLAADTSEATGYLAAKPQIHSASCGACLSSMASQNSNHNIAAIRANRNDAELASQLQTLTPILTSLLFRKCSGALRQHVEDIVQESLTRVWSVREKLRSFGESDVRPWLFKIAVNCATDWQRKQKRSPVSLTVDVIDHYRGDSSNEQRSQETLAKLKSCIAALSPAHRKIMRLRLEGRTYIEIAKELNISIKTVGTRLYRARKSLELGMSRAVLGTGGDAA